ncbi:MAG: ribbon-helix-helix protein, CopG family [Alphaproteobacteria bacterium]|nr:ribbon-helix-helix protein, CopG family [Alphaproteobacteria bacterium]
MVDNVNITVRVPADLRERLDTLARTTKCSRSDLTADALQRLVDQDTDEIEHIRQALEASRKPDARVVPHKQAMAWIRSRGTETPLPKPKGRRRSPG